MVYALKRKVSPLMLSEAPCDGGLSCISLLIFYFIFDFQQPSNPILSIFQISQYPPPQPRPNFSALKTFGKTSKNHISRKIIKPRTAN